MSNTDSRFVDLDAAWWGLYGRQDANYDPDGLSAQLYGPGLILRLLASFQGDPNGFEQLAVTNAAAGLAKIPDFARSATVTTEAVAVRLRLDGTAPTATVGLLIPASTIFTITGRKSLKGASFISNAANTSIDVAYFD